jgi:hypothetical protein
MKITKFEYKASIEPHMSCGTGYSEPDVFRVECDDGSVHTISIDIWYRTEEDSTQIFKDIMESRFEGKLENLDEAFEMYKDALRGTDACPYFWLPENYRS